MHKRLRPREPALVCHRPQRQGRAGDDVNISRSTTALVLSQIEFAYCPSSCPVDILTTPSPPIGFPSSSKPSQGLVLSQISFFCPTKVHQRAMISIRSTTTCIRALEHLVLVLSILWYRDHGEKQEGSV